jgi:hypothetical protein
MKIDPSLVTPLPSGKPLQRGTQIVYRPPHAPSFDDPSIELGFVTSGPTTDGSYFCRYFSNTHPSFLRTVANSELTPADSIYLYNHHDVQEINRLLVAHC